MGVCSRELRVVEGDKYDEVSIGDNFNDEKCNINFALPLAFAYTGASEQISASPFLP